jgi:hypothetical protein
MSLADRGDIECVFLVFLALSFFPSLGGVLLTLGLKTLGVVFVNIQGNSFDICLLGGTLGVRNYVFFSF